MPQVMDSALFLPEPGLRPSPDDHADIARFFLTRGLALQHAEMLDLALKTTREAIAVLSGNDFDSPATCDRTILRKITPVVLEVHRDALMANGYRYEAEIVDEVLAELR